MRYLRGFGLALTCLTFQAAEAEPVYLADGSVATRFGALHVDENQILLHRGRPLSPQIAGNRSLWIRDVYHLPTADVALVENEGGTACPIGLYFVTLTREAVEVVGPFGTCSEIERISVQGGVITISMPGFIGMPETAADRAAARRTHIFKYRNGVVNHNGKPLR